MPEAVMTVKGSIRQRNVEDLKPHPKNARVHSDEQVALIMNAITEFGFMVPVVVDEDTTILAGHGRWEAAKKLGMTKIPTIDAKHLTDAQKRAFIIADNKLVERGGWDTAMLSQEVVELNALDVDISLLGLLPDEANSYLSGEHTAFLGESEENGEGGQRSSRVNEFVQLNFTFTSDDRKQVVTYLEHIRQQNNLGTTAEALLRVCTPKTRTRTRA